MQEQHWSNVVYCRFHITSVTINRSLYKVDGVYPEPDWELNLYKKKDFRLVSDFLL